MAESSLMTKLQIKPRSRLLVLEHSATPPPVPDWPAGDLTVELAPGDPADAVLMFVDTRAALAQYAPAAFAATRPGGLVWIGYPKQSAKTGSDLNRDIVWSDLASSGWQPVRQIAIDATWSALRFRPDAEVKRRKM